MRSWSARRWAANSTGFDLGQTVTFDNTRWTVVGIFSAEGSVFESEIWADLPVLQSLFKRGACPDRPRAADQPGGDRGAAGLQR